MSQSWYIHHNGRTLGPMTEERLKQLVDAGKINPTTSVRLGASGDWTSASKISGLFQSTEIIASKPTADPPRQQIYSPILETSSVARQIECPFCAEMISENAKKCKHCGEFLDLTLRAAAESRQSPIPQQIVMNVAGGSAHSTSVANADATAKSKAGLSEGCSGCAGCLALLFIIWVITIAMGAAWVAT
jgi:hypothetical protein